MKLKQITTLLFTFFFVFAISSCNDDTTETEITGLSADAQIQKLKLTAKYNKDYETSLDSANYKTLEKTKFSIDQFQLLIYNSDSLPYTTKLKKYYAEFEFAASSPSKVQLIYPKDSVVDWNGSDSIDFSTYLYPRIKVTAANGSNSREYTIKVLVHQVDPDTLIWAKISKLQQPASITKQRTLLKGNTFHTFAIDNDNKLYLYKADKTAASWTKHVISGGLTTSILFESITLLNDKFYAVDNTKKGFSSTDGITWSAKNNNICNILGVLPASTAGKDSLLVITKNAGKYYFAKTLDLQTLKTKQGISEDFPISGFSSVTNYNRTDLNKNILTVTGGKNTSSQERNLTWIIATNNENVLQTAPNQLHSIFAAKSGIVSFLYDEHLYVLTDNKLYKSSSWGYKWLSTSTKEMLDPAMPKISGQSVVIDSENYVWVFGGVSGSPKDVWRGRLNKLNPKI